MRASGDIQFAPVSIPAQVPPQPPAWLRWLGDLLEAVFRPLGRLLGIGWPVLEKLLLGLAVIAAALVLWQALRWLAARRRRAAAAPPEPEWSPGQAQALALLEDADRLAAEGRYAEAAHLLLKRSVGHIAQSRPEWLQPATTAREIATLPALPDRARQAFAVIAERVERSLFALRDLGAEDWQAARAAYADFALVRLEGPAP